MPASGLSVDIRTGRIEALKADIQSIEKAIAVIDDALARGTKALACPRPLVGLTTFWARRSGFTLLGIMLSHTAMAWVIFIFDGCGLEAEGHFDRTGNALKPPHWYARMTTER